jgi:plasmid stabilization system protein ParE
MAFRVETSVSAEHDAIVILEWLVSRNAGDAGLRWFLAMEEAIGSLATFPHRCPLAPENSGSPIPIRQLLYGRKPHVYVFCSQSKATRFTCFIFATDAANNFPNRIK